jgi:CelD/BcsL family acetyltransferase involved in cellulose biosynthesis
MSAAVASRGLDSGLITNRTEIDALVPHWHDLLSRSAADVPFLSPDWLLPWWTVFGPQDGRRPMLYTLHDGGRLIALAPLLLRTHWHSCGVPFRRLELWGSGEPEADEICTDYLNLIVESGREAEAAKAFAAELDRRPWDDFVVPLMDGSGPMPELLAAAFRQRGFVASVEQTAEAPFVRLRGDWEAYLTDLGGRGRYLVRRSVRDFEAWAAGTGHLHEARTEAELAEGAAILHQLHAERWEGGAFRSPHFLRFHDLAMRTLLRRGALRLRWLTVRGEPVAALYDVVWGGREFFYQCGRRLDVPKGVRPGTVLLALAIRQAIEAGRSEFDLLSDATRYKRELAPSLRPVVQLRVVRPGLRERLRQALEWGKGVLRRWRTGVRAAHAGGERSEQAE